VTDDKGLPVDKASVIVKGTKLGTSTNALGVYTLNVPSTAKTLVISSVGMISRSIAINEGKFDVSLETDINSMAAVIVTVPYGTVKKTNFTGSENTINSSSLQKRPVADVTRAIEGLVPGIIATNGGGAPGTGAQILIRGVGSVSSNSAPLYVLNGTPYAGSITALSADDIESITVLKDASAAALYGSRAANGVIMITTKKGKKGKPNVTASVRQGYMSRGIPEYDRVNSKQYYELFWEAYKNSYLSQGESLGKAGRDASDVLTSSTGLVYNSYNVPGNQLVDTTGKFNPNAKELWNESWSDALFRQASRTNATFNVSGATENTDYFLSAGYLNEDGVVRNSGYKRYNFRLNLNVKATSWLNTGVDLDGSLAREKDVQPGDGGTATSNPFYFTRQIGPIYPIYQHDLITGAYVDTLGGHKYDYGVVDQMGTRPYAGRSNIRGTLDLDNYYSNIFNGNVNSYAEIKFLKDFSFKATLGLNYLSNNGSQYQNNQFGDAAPSAPNAGDGGRLTKTNSRQVSYTGNEILTWKKSFGSHHIVALAGHENYKFQTNNVAAYAAGFIFSNLQELNAGNSMFSPGPPNSTEDNYRIESYLGNVNYDYNQKYLASFSYRTDGSSKFAKDDRWGSFYSAGLGWRVSQEKFMNKILWINELKLRASYGESGNEDLRDVNGNPLYYSYTDYYYTNPTGTLNPPPRTPSPNILWEKNKTSDIGLDFVIFKNRLSGTFDWFNKVSSNLLFDVPLPISTGYPSGYQNIGTMQNRGIELQLGYNVIATRDFNWRVDVNFTHFKNKITKLPDGFPDGLPPRGTKKLQVGHDIFQFWLPTYAGVDASNGDPTWYKDILDANGKSTGKQEITNVYNKATFHNQGSALPKFSGGITNSFNYKGFDLSFLLTFSYGGLYYDGNYAGIMHSGDPGIAWSTDILGRWQKPGDVTNIPRLQTGFNDGGASTRWLVDGSWLNIKNITLSYTIPKSVLKNKAGVQVFINVDNAWLFTAKKGMDPQRAFNGTADATYTPFRTVSAGFTVNLQ
ncbi:MAG: SusC/RagA family TonB-linked outer membrane protein, partial [Ferruginibacter sp.]